MAGTNWRRCSRSCGRATLVTKVDRLARSVGDLQDIVKALRAQGVALKVTDQPIDTSTAAGKAFLDMLAVFAEFETSLRRERQMEGMAKAKVAGVYRGRKATISADEIKQLKREGIGASTIAPRMGTGGPASTGCWTPMLALARRSSLFPARGAAPAGYHRAYFVRSCRLDNVTMGEKCTNVHLVQGTGERAPRGKA